MAISRITKLELIKNSFIPSYHSNLRLTINFLQHDITHIGLIREQCNNYCSPNYNLWGFDETIQGVDK